MLKQRVITSIILVLITYAVLFLVPEPVFVVIAWTLCLVGIYELSRMYKFDQINQVGLLVIISLIAFMVYFSTYNMNQLVQIAILITWCIMVPILLIWRPKSFSKFGIGLIAALLFVPAFYALVVLHILLGSLQLISIMAIAWVADIGAYFIGKRFGRHKLAPTISPGKTIEGIIGGLVFVVIYLLILKYFGLAVYLYGYLMVFKFALILTTASILGDLMESWLKRIAKVKDSGVILPGHGGVFDRIDSLIAVLAVAFAIIQGFG